MIVLVSIHINTVSCVCKWQ